MSIKRLQHPAFPDHMVEVDSKRADAWVAAGWIDPTVKAKPEKTKPAKDDTPGT